jgi:hypothetical protein
MADRVQSIKWESPSGGGTQTDTVPTEINPNEDGLDARSLFLQNDSSADSNVEVSRDASNNMTFKDGVIAGTKTLTELLAGAGITADQHKTLRQLIHFIDNGPAEGFASGAYREVMGTIFPTAIIWYTDSGKTEKIVEKNITWTGINPTTIEWKMYDTDGSTLLASVSDSISYTGVFETSRTRTITIY